jgi:integrase
MVFFRGHIRKEEEMGVFKKGKNYYVDFYVETEKGLQRRRKKVGPSKSLAEKVLTDIQSRIAKKQFLGLSEPKRMTFGVFAVEYLEYSRANKAASSYGRDLTTVQAHLFPVWGEFMLHRITARAIEDYKLRRLESVSQSTLNRELNTIKSMFKMALEWGYLEESPAKTVKWLRTPREHPRYLTEEDATKFLKAAKESDNQHLYAIVAVALHTGMRRGEILRLQWRDIDFKRRKITVASRDGEHTKNYESRMVPLHRFLVGVLGRHPRRLDSPYLFCNEKGEPFADVDTSFRNAWKRSGVSYFRFHDLRHTFASWLVMKGADLRTVQELLGHKDIRMTLRYAHLAPDHMRRVVDILDSPADEDGDVPTKILDGHYLDTEQVQNENQDAAKQA